MSKVSEIRARAATGRPVTWAQCDVAHQDRAALLDLVTRMLIHAQGYRSVLIAACAPRTLINAVDALIEEAK